MTNADVLEVREVRKGALDSRNHSLQGWSEGPKGSFRRFAYDYLHGHGEFLFPASGEAVGLPLVAREFGDSPTDVTAISAKHQPFQPCGEIWQQSADLAAGNLCVVCGWDKQFVLVEDVEIMGKDEIVVPSRIRLERLQRDPDIFGGPIYLSIIEGTLDVFRRPRLSYGELDALALPLVAVGGDKLPNSVVERGAQIMDRIADNQSEFSYDGFVSFGSDGAFSRLVIRFDSVAERAALLDNVVSVEDVLLGPLDL